MTLKEFRRLQKFFQKFEQMLQRKPLLDTYEQKAREVLHCKRVEGWIDGRR